MTWIVCAVCTKAQKVMNGLIIQIGKVMIIASFMVSNVTRKRMSSLLTFHLITYMEVFQPALTRRFQNSYR